MFSCLTDGGTRLAGHVETGRDSITDPAIGRARMEQSAAI